jgi:cyclopropane-fatty-acyl-phospholipid synthase
MATHRISPPAVPDVPPEKPVRAEWRWPGADRLVRKLVERLRTLLGEVPLRFELWNGTSHALSAEPPCATVAVRSPGALLRLALDPSRFFGDAYSAGEVEVRGSLTRGLEAIFERWSRRPPELRRRRAGPGVLERARLRAQHHYDLGNDFYRLWLDEDMVYTCAYFESPSLSLFEAQRAKLDYVCRKVQLRPGHRVLEAGCGWGALARHMALEYGAHVVACNISREQVRYAQARAEKEGFADRVRYVEDDFRNLEGTYDVFVSLGMLEHVGHESYGDLGRLIHERLDPRHGRGLLHFIGRNRPEPLNSWARRRIFPGAYPPTLSEALRGVLEPWDFTVLDVENLRRHYVRTLAHWRERFEAVAPEVQAMFDERFVRAWRLYLAGAEAAFAAGWMQLFQVVFAGGRGHDVPWTRDALYREAPRA